MTQWQTLYTGVSRAAWGYFFLYFDIRLGQLNILPEFGAYLLFLSAIHFLEGQRRDLALLCPLGWLLAAWSGLGWAAELFGTTLDFPVVGIVIGAVQMYFHFQMMTDFAALAQCYQGADQTLDRRLLRWRTLQTLLLTATTILFYLQERLPGSAARAVYPYLVIMESFRFGGTIFFQFLSPFRVRTRLKVWL